MTDSGQLWRMLYKQFFGGYSPHDNERDFRSAIGVHPEVAELIFLRYGISSKSATRSRLFIALHYLKNYPKESNVYRKFGYKTRTTYRNHVKETLYFLDSVMKEVYLDKRFEGHIAEYGLFEGMR
jgi:hypothetical protein